MRASLIPMVIALLAMISVVAADDSGTDGGGGCGDSGACCETAGQDVGRSFVSWWTILMRVVSLMRTRVLGKDRAVTN